LKNRWLQLVLGIVAMIMIANLQYGWTLFVNPIADEHGWKKASIQVAFTLFVLLETWLVPIEGYLIDKLGPKLLTGIGGVLVGLAWIINAQATSLAMLYVGAIVGGIGAGTVYGAMVGNALKWFPDKRGLAAGLTAAGFGAGAALTIVPISNVISTQGYHAAFMTFGIIQGVAIVLVSFFLLAPGASDVLPAPAESVRATNRNSTPAQMLASPAFYVLYLTFVLVATGGLVGIAQLGPIAKDFTIDKVPVSLLGITLATLQWALMFDRILNGLARPTFGYISDRIGRENTMFIAFSIEAVVIIAVIMNAANPVLFVLLSGCMYLAYGEIFSLFPALSADVFGRKFATTNYGLLYTAKGTAALIVPFASVLKDATGSWMPIFFIAAGFNAVAALLALFVLKPMCKRALAADAAAAVAGAPTAAAVA
jgi:OFA family oxalate/formate antiporter-like MFS transporter